MFDVDIDKEQNLLTIKIAGDFNNQQGVELLHKLQTKINGLTHGFKLLTDLSEIEKMEWDSYQSIDSIMELCNNHGVAKVIRVVTRESCDIGFNIMSLFHYPQSVLIHTCKTFKEAEDYLKI
ncbi:MAG: hypothetical protein ABIG64_00730 [Candidatus Omnitrophota bacterium]